MPGQTLANETPAASLLLRPEGLSETNAQDWGAHWSGGGPAEDPRHRVKPTATQARIFGSMLDAQRDFAILLDHADHPRWQGRAERLLACCSHPNAVILESGEMALSLGRCRDRLCQVCSKIRARQCAARVRSAVGAMDSPRFLTLTVHSTSEHKLSERMDHLRSSFRHLRRTPAWRRHVLGGVYAVEAKRGERDNWHAHIHAIIDGEYWPQKMISDAWRHVTGDSYRADIRAIRSKEKAARYISKYVTKTSEIAEWSDALVVEFASAIHGVRMLHTFGSLHGQKLDTDEQEIAHSPAAKIVPISRITWHAHRGCRRARGLLDRLRRLGGAWGVATGGRTDAGRSLGSERLARRRRRLAICVRRFVDDDLGNGQFKQRTRPVSVRLDPPVTLPLADWLTDAEPPG